MPLEAQDGDQFLTFEILALVGGSVVSTTNLSLYFQKGLLYFVSIVQEAGCVVGAGLCPRMDSVLRLSSPSELLKKLYYSRQLP
jgi:hypothetical protein